MQVHDSREETIEARHYDCVRLQLNQLARDTGGQLRPRFELVLWPIGRLACGDLAIEPTLGLVRVADLHQCHDQILSNPKSVQVRWCSDLGPCMAEVRYPAAAHMRTCRPALADRLLVRQALDQARRCRRPVVASVARLIAGHLHRGPGTAMYTFALDGRVPGHLCTELAAARKHPAPYVRQWSEALAAYCTTREQTGPLAEWTMTTHPTGQAPSSRRSAPPEPSWPKRLAVPVEADSIGPELALQLMEAAFELGIASTRIAAFKSPYLSQARQRVLAKHAHKDRVADITFSSQSTRRNQQHR
jgi:hypothetical protein